MTPGGDACPGHLLLPFLLRHQRLRLPARLATLEEGGVRDLGREGRGLLGLRRGLLLVGRGEQVLGSAESRRVLAAHHVAQLVLFILLGARVHLNEGLVTLLACPSEGLLELCPISERHDLVLGRSYLHIILLLGRVVHPIN